MCWTMTELSVNRGLTIYYVLSQCIVYWTHFQNIHTFIYQKTLLLTLFYLFWKLMKAFTVSLRTNIILHHIKKHYFILIVNQSQSIKTIYFQIYFIYTIKCGWLGPIFGIFVSWFLNSLKPLHHLTPKIHDIVPSLCWLEKYLIFDQLCF